MEFYSDLPIKNNDDDRLNRVKFAKNLAKAIQEYSNDDCLTIGLIGKWGSGKSSIINLTKNHLDMDNLIIIDFNPWYFSTQNNLYQQFFNLISSEIEKREFGDVFWIKKKYIQIKRQYNKLPKITRENKKITQVIKEKFYSLRELRNLNVVNEYFNRIKSNSSVNFNVPGMGYTYNFDESRKEFNSVSYLKTKCNEYFEDFGYNFLIIIDDIDRMTSTEIEQIFLLVKSLANFPKFIYLLSFDNEVVINSLSDVPEDFRCDFIEKIIQIPIIVPEITDSDLNNYFQTEIRGLYYDYLNENFRGEDEFDNVSRIVGYFIKNIRDLKRYVNAIQFYSAFMDELNVNDMFILIAIHTFEYEIYLKIKDELNRIILDKWIYFKDENEIKTVVIEFLEDSRKLLEKINFNELESTLIALFPIFNIEHLNMDRLLFDFDKWDKECRIAHYGHFNKYFTLTVENNEISSVELDMFLKLTDVNEIYSTFLAYEEKGNLKAFISDFMQFSDRIPDENAECFINAIMKLGDKFCLKNDLSDYWDKICRVLFEKINSKEESFKIIKVGICDESIFLISRLVYHLSYYYGHCGEYNEETPEEYDILYDNDLLKLEELLLGKLRELVSNKKLLSHEKLGSILFYWISIENAESVKEYLKSNIKEDNDKVAILNAIENHNELKYLMNINF